MKKQPTISLLIDHPRLIDRAFRKKLAALGRLQYWPGFRKYVEKKQVRILRETDIAVIGWGPCMLPLSLLETGFRLKYICHMTGELKRYIPLEYIRAGIKVTNWGKSLSFATAEGALALLLAVMKDISGLDRTTRTSGRAGWRPRPFLTLKGARVGIYGLSPIGKIAARLLKPFGPVLSFYDPTVDPECLIGSNRQQVRAALRHLEELLVSSAEDLAAAGLIVVNHRTVDAGCVGKWLAAGIRVLDTVGIAGVDSQAPGYEGLYW